MDISKRNSALDITRICALFCVISVHFFLNNGFYNEPMFGKRMYVMTVMRTAFMICVPLFIMLTGYLMCNKKLSAKYYLGIIKTLSIYVLASIACLVYKMIIYHENLTFSHIISSLLNGSGANYAWYIEMYFGLFLLIPFINLIYNNLGSHKAKLALLATLLFMTAIPSLANIYNFRVEGWWKTPYLSREYHQLMPDWWVMIYPLTYYFLGAYLREFPLKLKQHTKLIFWGISIIAFGSFNYYRSHYGFFEWGIYNDWYGFQNVIMTFFAFSFLSSIKTDKYPKGFKWFLMKVSDLCLGGYLVSYIFDNYFYPILNAHVPTMVYRLNWYPVIVPIVFICSLLLSLVLNLIYGAAEYGCKLAYGKLTRTESPKSRVTEQNQRRLDTLETARLILRPFRESDAEDMFEYASDPDVGPRAGWKPHKSVDESLDTIRHFITDGDVWAIELKETHKVIGSVGLHRTINKKFTEELNIAYDIELGYVLGKTYWGRGIMPEAAAKLIEHTFSLGTKTMLVAHFDGNVQSKRVIEKLGFKPVGRIEQCHERYDGEMLNESFYLLTAEEYYKQKAKLSDSDKLTVV
ncbi:MAG: GNAT family N-acetyltransferase [Clostridiales bacterium]|nr:GNAT family N-acetyltransferase [Clostridiales bacterium]